MSSLRKSWKANIENFWMPFTQIHSSLIFNILPHLFYYSLSVYPLCLYLCVSLFLSLYIFIDLYIYINILR